MQHCYYFWVSWTSNQYRWCIPVSRIQPLLAWNWSSCKLLPLIFVNRLIHQNYPRNISNTYWTLTNSVLQLLFRCKWHLHLRTTQTFKATPWYLLSVLAPSTFTNEINQFIYKEILTMKRQEHDRNTNIQLTLKGLGYVTYVRGRVWNIYGMCHISETCSMIHRIFFQTLLSKNNP